MSAGPARRPPAALMSLLLCAALALAGCAQLTDIHDRSLIFGLGLDEGPAHGTVTLSAQAMHPQPGGGGGGGGGGSGGGGGGGGGSGEWKTLTASGQTLSAALGHLQAQTDRQVFLGQLGIVILGSSLARQGTLHNVDALVRSPQVAETTPITVVDGAASQFLQEGDREQVAWRVRSFVTKPRLGVSVLSNPLWHFMTQSLDLAGATYAPLFAGNRSGEGLRFLGTAVFLRGRMVDTLGLRETSALAWMVKREGFGGVTIGSDGNEFHVELHNVRAHWDVSDPSAPHLYVSASGEVTASPGQTLADRPKGMRQQVASEMARELSETLLRLQADGTDLVGIGERLRERGTLPSGPWPQRFSQLHLTVAVRVHLVPGKVR